jgi:hypothetical protein
VGGQRGVGPGMGGCGGSEGVYQPRKKEAVDAWLDHTTGWKPELGQCVQNVLVSMGDTRCLCSYRGQKVTLRTCS